MYDGAIPSCSASSAIVVNSPDFNIRFQRNARASALTNVLNRPEFTGVVYVQMLRSFFIFVQAFIESLLCFLGRDISDGTVQPF